MPMKDFVSTLSYRDGFAVHHNEKKKNDPAKNSHFLITYFAFVKA